MEPDKAKKIIATYLVGDPVREEDLQEALSVLQDEEEKCETFRDHMDEFYETRDDAREERFPDLARHLKGCNRCQAAYTEFEDRMKRISSLAAAFRAEGYAAARRGPRTMKPVGLKYKKDGTLIEFPIERTRKSGDSFQSKVRYLEPYAKAMESKLRRAVRKSARMKAAERAELDARVAAILLRVKAVKAKASSVMAMDEMREMKREAEYENKPCAEWTVRDRDTGLAFRAEFRRAGIAGAKVSFVVEKDMEQRLKTGLVSLECRYVPNQSILFSGPVKPGEQVVKFKTGQYLIKFAGKDRTGDEYILEIPLTVKGGDPFDDADDEIPTFHRRSPD